MVLSNGTKDDVANKPDWTFWLLVVAVLTLIVAVLTLVWEVFSRLFLA